MLYVSFHGGKPGDDGVDPINQVWAYDKDGKVVSKAVLQGLPPGASELRGLTLDPAGALYVVVGYKDDSEVLAFTAPDKGSASYTGLFVSFTGASYPVHPFAIAFGPAATFVSCQDSNVVLALGPPGSRHAGQPLASPPALGAYTPLLAGTFVASADGNLPGVPKTAAVAEPLGLAVKIVDAAPDAKQKQKVQNSVRDVAVVDSQLIVADEAGNAVKLYDLATGGLAQALTDKNLRSPVHLLPSGKDLYIASKGTDMILRATLSDGVLGKPKVVTDKLKEPAGLAIGGDHLIAASRDKKHKGLYTMPLGTDHVTPTLLVATSDYPEFVLHTK